MTTQILSTKEGDPRLITATQTSALLKLLYSGGPDNTEYDFHLPEKSTDPLVMLCQGDLYPQIEMSRFIPQDPSTGEAFATISKNSRNWTKYIYTFHFGLVFTWGDYPFALVPRKEGGQQQRFFAARRVVGTAGSSSFNPGNHLGGLEKDSVWRDLGADEKSPVWLLEDYLDTTKIKSAWERGKKS